MKGWLHDFLGDEAGLTAMEYALLLALLGIVAAAILVTLEGGLEHAFCMLDDTGMGCP